MIISVAELKAYIDTSLDDLVLEAKLQALEISIRNQTNNNFQNINKRFVSDISDNKIVEQNPLIVYGDTIQISESLYNNGIYVYTEDLVLIDEPHVLVTKVEYPIDVKMGVVDILKWKLRNESANSGDTSKKDIVSETISRHSVTYATDSTEADFDERFGVPKKYTAFLKAYYKARF